MENKYRSFNDLPLTLCVEDLMPILGIGRNTAYELVRSGQIFSVKIGRHPQAGPHRLSERQRSVLMTKRAVDIFNRPCYTRCMNGYSLQYCGKEDLQL